MNKEKKKHPSYGKMSLSRVSCTEAHPLFGSSIKHRDTICLSIYEAEAERTLSTDTYYEGAQIIKVEMSQSQFAEAITHMNSTGVPVTIRKRIDKSGRIDYCPYEGQRQKFEDEFKEVQNQNKEEFTEFVDSLKELFSEKASIGKKDRDEILHKLDVLQGRLFSNEEFVYKQFNRQMDKTETEAKGEIEAFFQNRINTLASIAISAQAENLKEIDNPVDIE